MRERDKMKFSFSRGFDHGKYQNAYVSEHLDETSYEKLNGEFFKAGFLLGFYSSYELHEVPEEWQEQVAVYRDEFGGWL